MNKNIWSDYKKTSILLIFITAVILITAVTYAVNQDATGNVKGSIIRVDEESYGNTTFDSSNLNFKPILDNNIEENTENVIHIDFLVGGSIFNDTKNIIYDIALNDLELDCNLLSPYIKWRLIKNETIISEGSLDNNFDTIKNGRLVLTPIQQDLKDYSEDKTTYDHYDFYMWFSDSCQSTDLTECLNAEEQSDMLNKRLKGKIEVELYAGAKTVLIRQPSDELNEEYCVAKEDEKVYENR